MTEYDLAEAILIMNTVGSEKITDDSDNGYLTTQEKITDESGNEYRPPPVMSTDKDTKKEISNKDNEKEKKKDEIPFSDFQKQWKRYFPRKPQPRNIESARKKFKTRMKNEWFRDYWIPALHHGSLSYTLINESWFNWSYFLKNDENPEKVYNNDWDWLDKKKGKARKQGYMKDEFAEFIEE